ncbi:polysaccharide deacetylase family protein [Nocardioides donggukensis]|uniref:Polysaccharide deacetylase family protein n=1 Tax=Nocardioides donggukensis TaxID=2774019 RepID=A0A927K463_9ACTN|nr:polysaccharide deacetylase family protein [Nocardioides donggukensis]MBD8869388.1 polysaccharide deacetylase family protein [Nocardioides donggukensis]
MTGRSTGGRVRLPVLMYHAVGSPLPRGLEALTVPPTVLADQLAVLRGAGYELLGLTEALAAAATGRRVAALTFDDAFLDFHERGLEVVAGAGARATLYAPTAHLGGTACWLPGPGVPLMSGTQVRELTGAGIEVGSHGHVHHPLDALPTAELRDQLRRSRSELEDLVGHDVVSLCYPHGYHSRRVRAKAAAAGYRNACEIGHRVHHSGRSPFAVSRLLVGPDHHDAALLHLVERGPAQALPRGKRVAQPAWRAVRRTVRATTGETWT